MKSFFILALVLCFIACIYSNSVPPGGDVKKVIDFYIQDNDVFIFSKSYCPFCKRAKQMLTELNVNFGALELDRQKDGMEIQQELAGRTNVRTVPSIWFKGKYFGGSDKLALEIGNGKLFTLLDSLKISYKKPSEKEEIPQETQKKDL